MSIEFKPGDWRCQECNAHNFSSRIHCRSCGIHRPNKEPAREPYDWVCNSCQTLNFKWRKECYKCSKPQSAGLFSIFSNMLFGSASKTESKIDPVPVQKPDDCTTNHPSPQLFYFCNSCNRKYKTTKSLVKHYGSAHKKKVTEDTLGPPLPYENSTAISKRRKLEEEKRKEREQIKTWKVAKQEAAKQQQLQREQDRKLQEARALLQEERNQLEKNHEQIDKLLSRVSKEKRPPKEGECIICMDADMNTAIAPCGHMCSCYECAINIQKCPMCRGVVANVMKIYIA